MANLDLRSINKKKKAPMPPDTSGTDTGAAMPAAGSSVDDTNSLPAQNSMAMQNTPSTTSGNGLVGLLKKKKLV